MNGDPHGRGALLEAGAPLVRARLAMILLHGRGSGARDMLALAEQFALPDIAYFAPEAAANSWWPQRSLAPLHANEPGITSGLKPMEGIAEDLEEHGFDAERIVVLGFSQRAARPFRRSHTPDGGDVCHPPAPPRLEWPQDWHQHANFRAAMPSSARYFRLHRTTDPVLSE